MLSASINPVLKRNSIVLKLVTPFPVAFWSVYGFDKTFDLLNQLYLKRKNRFSNPNRCIKEDYKKYCNNSVSFWRHVVI